MKVTALPAEDRLEHIVQIAEAAVGMDQHTPPHLGAAAEGVTTSHEEHAVFLEKAMALSGRQYFLIDSTKFARAGLFNFAALGIVLTINHKMDW